MTKMPTSLRSEAHVLGRYYLGKTPSQRAVDTYQALVGTRKPSASDQKLLEFARHHPRTIGLLDSGLLTLRPQSELRRRLYLMFAILESDPLYYDRFTPKNRSPLYLLYLAWVGVRAIYQRIAGYVLVRTLL